MDDLKKAVEAVAKEEGLTMIEAISMMQAGAARINNDEALDALIKLKREYIKIDCPWAA